MHHASTTADNEADTKAVTLPQTQSLEQTTVSGGSWV